MPGPTVSRRRPASLAPRGQATTLLGAGGTLGIERQGTPIGFFVPIEAEDREHGREALGRLVRLLDRLTKRPGVDD